MKKKKFYRFKEIAPHGLETCDVITEDFHDKWGNLDQSAVDLDKTQSLVRLDHTEEEHEVLEIAEQVFESYEDRVHTLEVALRAISTQETRDKRFNVFFTEAKKGIEITFWMWLSNKIQFFKPAKKINPSKAFQNAASKIATEALKISKNLEIME